MLQILPDKIRPQTVDSPRATENQKRNAVACGLSDLLIKSCFFFKK